MTPKWLHTLTMFCAAGAMLAGIALLDWPGIGRLAGVLHLEEPLPGFLAIARSAPECGRPACLGLTAQGSVARLGGS